MINHWWNSWSKEMGFPQTL